MRVTTRVLSLASTAALLLAGAVAAQPPRVLLGELSCVPKNGHTVTQAIAAPMPAGAQVRIYFRRQGYGDFYWVPARPTSDGRFWGVLPVPEPDNLQAEVYAAVVAPNGMPLAQSPVRSVPVDKDCRSHLDTAQTADASTLTVGETSLGQKFRKVAWWQCEGIRERIDVKGERRNDEACVPVPLWWERTEMLAPFAVIAGGGITTVVIGNPPPENPPELSVANP